MDSYAIAYKLPISPWTSFEKSWNPTEITCKNFIPYLCVHFSGKKNQLLADSQRGIEILRNSVIC